MKLIPSIWNLLTLAPNATFLTFPAHEGPGIVFGDAYDTAVRVLPLVEDCLLLGIGYGYLSKKSATKLLGSYLYYLLDDSMLHQNIVIFYSFNVFSLIETPSVKNEIPCGLLDEIMIP
jgi:hypothetical protein